MTLVLHALAMNQQEKTFSGFKHIFQAWKAPLFYVRPARLQLLAGPRDSL